LTDADLKAAVSRHESGFKESGVAVEQVDTWGMQTLASEIRHQTKGYYVLMGFRAQPEQLKRVVERFKLDKDVLRHRIFRLDEAR
jgi:small subunit ribosomal protein S6